MSNLKKYYEFHSSEPNVDIMDEFKEWFGSKLNIKIGEFIGSGVEGEVYAIDKNKVIKFTYPNVSSAQHLSSRNIDGIVKIYQTGNIEVPKRFKYPNQQKYNPSYDYKGINLLEPNRTFGEQDYTIGYIIMERLTPDKELSSMVDYLNEHLWMSFAKGEWKEFLNDRRDSLKRVFVLAENDYHQDTIDIIQKTRGLFGGGLFRTILNYDSDNLVSDFRKFLHAHNFGPSYPFKQEMFKLFDRIVMILKNVKKAGIDWDDIHGEQFAYNSKGEVTAFDISFGISTEETDDGSFQMKNPIARKARKKKVKNVIRESKVKKFFEYSEFESIYKGDERRAKLGGRSEIVKLGSVKEALDKYASWYDINCETPLYRGLKIHGAPRKADFLLTEPSKHERVSVDTDNFYNLIIDNDNRWSEFPKRSKSIIGSTDKSRAGAYGTLYRVIPIFENSKIAIAPSYDIWYSFDKSFRTDNPLYTKCSDCGGAGDIPHPAGGETECGRCLGSGTESVTDLNGFNSKLRNDFKLDKDTYTWSEFKKKIGDAIQNVTGIFDPKLNGFMLEDYNNNTKINGGHEVWTDAKCLLIREDLLP